jgi:uncharacterized repeat protein (TIGR03803 family)
MKAISVILAAGLVGSAFLRPVFAAEGTQAVEKVVYSFGGKKDGDAPGSLMQLKSLFYGTTSQADFGGGGKVFRVDRKTGAEKVLISFCNHVDNGCPGGWKPNGPLVVSKGTLYGTTLGGGLSAVCLVGCGTVFGVDPKTGAETVLYAFCSQENCTDGAAPAAGLILMNGTLYGTTSAGGSAGDGVIFAIDPGSHAETVLYSFCSQAKCADGNLPQSGLIAVNGALYGTTSAGGANGEGEAFSLNPASGALTVLYSFCSQPNCADGSEPQSSLVAANGVLYGTTSAGGAHAAGEVFSLDPATGTEAVLYSFCAQNNCTDGQYPSSGLLAADGTLYGETFRGGAHAAGELYSVDPGTGAQTVLYSFCAQQYCVDGEEAGGNLLARKGAFYGTTSIGGAIGYGTVFSFKPAE